MLFTMFLPIHWSPISESWVSPQGSVIEKHLSGRLAKLFRNGRRTAMTFIFLAMGATGLDGAYATEKTVPLQPSKMSSQKPLDTELPTTTIQVAEQVFVVELATTQAEQAQGLMYRAALDDGAGMLFVFPRPGPQAFWMKNTMIPLDMLFFDAQRRLVTLHQQVMPCTTPQCPSYPATRSNILFVLEINAGLAEKYGFKLGDILQF